MTDLQVEIVQAHAHGRLLLDGRRVAHVQVALLVLQLGHLVLQRAEVPPHALVLRLEALRLLLLPHDLLDLRLQGGAAGAHPAGLAAGLLQLLLHPRDGADQVLRQLRVLDQACRGEEKRGEQDQSEEADEQLC